MKNNIEKWLKARLKQFRFANILLFLLKSGIAVLVLFFISYPTYTLIKPDSSSRHYILIISSLILLIAVTTKIYSLSRKFSIKHIASLIEEKYKNTNNYINTYLSVKESDNFSKSIIDAIKEKIINSIPELKNTQKIYNSKKIRQSALLLLILGIFQITLFFSVNSFQKHFQYFFETSREYPEPLKPLLTVYPGDTTLVKGNSLNIEINAFNFNHNSLQLHSKEIGDIWTQTELTKPEITDSSKVFYHIFNNLEKSMVYFIRNVDVSTDTFSVNLIEYPLITNIKMKYIYPEYSKITPKIEDGNNGNISALKGTKIIWQANINNPVEEAFLIFNDSLKTVPQIFQEKTIKTEFDIMNNGFYYVIIKDEFGNSNIDTIKYDINIIPDEYPLISIEQPGKNIDIDENMIVDLSLHIADDFSVSDLELHYKINDNVTDVIKLNRFTNTQDIVFPFIWYLEEYNLLPEDVITYWGVVYDNDNVSGPKNSKSYEYKIRFPSLFEIFEEVNREQNLITDSLDHIIDKERKLTEKTEDLKRKLLKDPKMDFQQKEELKEILKQQENLQKDIHNIDKKLNEMANKLNKNNAVSQEIQQRMQKIQELVQELKDSNLLNDLKKFQEMVNQVDQQTLQQQMKDFNVNQKDLLDKLENTLKTLEKMKTSLKMDELVKKTEEMMKIQKELENRLGKENMDKLSQKQNQLAEQMKDMENDVQEFSEQLDSDEMKKQMENLAENMKNMKLSEEMQNMSGQMKDSKQPNQQMKQQMSNMNQKLSKLNQMMSQMQMAMQSQISEKVKRMLDKAIYNLIKLTELQNQEQYIFDTYDKIMFSNKDEASELRPSILGRLADYSWLVKNTIDSLNIISQTLPIMPPETLIKFGNIFSSTSELAGNLEKNKYKRISEDYKKIKNEIVIAANDLIELKKKINNQQSGGGGGSGNMMQQMKALSQQQMALNKLTQMLFNKLSNQGMGQNKSMQDPEMQRRLADNQRRIRDKLNEMIDKYGDKNSMVKRLRKEAKEMNEIAQQLQNGNIDRKLLERQEKILSRMLEAQKSVRERKVSKKREGKTGEDVYRDSPLNTLTKTELQQELHKEMLEALKYDLPPEYKQMIRQYYQRLMQEVQNTQ